MVPDRPRTACRPSPILGISTVEAVVIAAAHRVVAPVGRVRSPSVSPSTQASWCSGGPHKPTAPGSEPGPATIHRTEIPSRYLHRSGVEQRQLVGPITRRSWVRIPPPPLFESAFPRRPKRRSSFVPDRRVRLGALAHVGRALLWQGRGGRIVTGRLHHPHRVRTPAVPEPGPAREDAVRVSSRWSTPTGRGTRPRPVTVRVRLPRPAPAAVRGRP